MSELSGDERISRSIPIQVKERQPFFWANPRVESSELALSSLGLTMSDVRAAQARWQRFQPLFVKLFPQTAATQGHIDSPFVEIGNMARLFPQSPDGSRLFVKSDHDLPITGSIKARGGVYELLTIAEDVALKEGLISSPDDTLTLGGKAAAETFGRYKILVGSTGNLGYSVGLMARALGFQAEVHMSKDAKAWKKKRLRDIGVDVVEHPGSYTTAVAAARTSSRQDPRSFFVDDENSLALFLGYSTAAFDVKRQMEAANIKFDVERPVEFYLPCGVGGAPGGITFGLKALLGDAVRCYFVEPVNAACMLVQLACGTDRPIALGELGLAGETIADGLAVSAASELVARMMDRLVDGCFTCTDADMVDWVKRMWQSGGLRLEPSAASGFCALSLHLAAMTRASAAHVVWTTGGSQLPEAEFLALING